MLVTETNKQIIITIEELPEIEIALKRNQASSLKDREDYFRMRATAIE